MTRDPPKIRDLAIIGDRHTAALVSRQAEILWYCPGRFDAPGLLSGLLGGGGESLSLVAPGAEPRARSYLGEGGVLRTMPPRSGRRRIAWRSCWPSFSTARGISLAWSARWRPAP
jgi:hypothetical protein